MGERTKGRDSKYVTHSWVSKYQPRSLSFAHPKAPSMEATRVSCARSNKRIRKDLLMVNEHRYTCVTLGNVTSASSVAGDTRLQSMRSTIALKANL